MEKNARKKRTKKSERRIIPNSQTDNCIYGTETGILWRGKKAEGEEEGPPDPDVVANFKFTHLGKILEDDGAEQRTFFQFRARMEKVDYGPFRVPSQEFYNIGKLATQFLGPRARIEPGNLNPARVRAAIQRFAKQLPDQIARTASGWFLINGEWCFLHAGGSIDMNGHNSNFKAELPPDLQMFTLPAPPTGQKRKTAVKASLGLINAGPARTTVPVLAAIYRAPLGSPGVSVHLNGPSGAGKTTMAVFVAQHFGSDFREDCLPVSWQGTGLAIQETLYSTKDLAVVIDDYNPQRTNRKIEEYEEKADLVFRGVANASGRARLNPDGSKQIPHRPRALVVSTGEVLPSGASCLARLVSIPFQSGSIDFSKMEPYQQRGEKGFYAQAMAGYIQWIAGRYTEIQKAIPAKTREFQSKIIVKNPRNAENLACLAVGFEYFLTFADEIGATKTEEREALWGQAWEALLSLTGEQTELQLVEDIELEVMRLWKSAVEFGKLYLLDGLDAPMPGEPNDCIGWRDADDTWYLDPHRSYAGAVKLFREQNRTLSLKKHELWNRLVQKKLILKEKADRNDVQRTINGKSKWVIAVPLETFKKVEGD